MEASETSLWGGLGIIAGTLFVIFGTIYAVFALCNLVGRCRDKLRARYLGHHLVLYWYDLVAIPIWIVLELLCLVGAVLLALLTIWIVYDTACGLRDWWHQGARKRR